MSQAIHPYTVESSEYLHRRPWLTVRRDSVLLENGHRMLDYFVLEYPDWVNTLAVTEDGMFVMVEQYRHGLGKVGVELCAGVMDATDGSALVAAQRELLEETGYGGGEWQPWCTLSANPATHSNLSHGFLATGVRKTAEPKLDTTEELRVLLLKPEQVKGMLIRGEIVQALQAASLWKYFALHKA